MSLAVAFINTQKFEEPIGEVGDELQLITDVFRVFSEDSDFGQVVADRLIPVVVAELRNFLVSREESSKMSFGKGRNLFSGFENNIKALIDGLNEDIFSSIPAIVDIVLAVVRGLKLENIKQFISDLWDIAENDLGINGETIRQLFSDIFQAVITELQKDYLQGDRTKQSVALYDFSFSVENLRVFVLEEMQIPTVGKQILLNAVTDLWQRSGIEDALSTIEQVFAATDDVVEPLSQIAQCISAQLQTSPGVGAENGTSSSDSETVLAWYASWVAGKNVYYSADIAQSENIFVNPQLKYFTYKHISKEDMEKIAFHTAWIVPVLETIPHFASLEKGDIWNNLTNIFVNGIDATLIGWPKVNLPKWAHWLSLPIYTVLAGFESHEDRWSWGDDPYVIVNLLGDVGETYLYRRISWSTREAFLSVLTLLNHSEDDAFTLKTLHRQRGEFDETAWATRNNNCFEGTCYFYGELMSMLLPGILSHTDKRNYGFIGNGPSAQFWYCGLGGSAISWASEYLLGGITARLLAGEWFDNDIRYSLMPFRGRCVKGLFFSDLWNADEWVTTVFTIFGLVGRLADNMIYLYLFTNRNTDDGTYCLDDTSVERKFMGFPDIENTSYVLPWTDGRTMQCVQNPMGIWSHFPDGKQTYAYDFSHKEGEPVLCSRAGIVKRGEDTVPDHDNSPLGWNFIQIVHVMEIAPGDSVPANLIRYPDVYSPYTGRRPYSDPAPTSPGSGGMQQYADTNTDIPLNVVFPALPDGTDPTPRASAARPVGTSFAFIDINQDRAIAGKTFTDSPNVVFAPDATDANHGSMPSYPVGTTFLPPTNSPVKGFEPMQATCCAYGHGLQGFVGRVFSSRLARPNKTTPWTISDVEGEFIQQGEQIMEAGDTGVSAYNHLHSHVTGLFDNTSDGNYLLTIPFLYQKHGVVKAMNFYTAGED